MPSWGSYLKTNSKALKIQLSTNCCILVLWFPCNCSFVFQKALMGSLILWEPHDPDPETQMRWSMVSLHVLTVQLNCWGKACRGQKMGCHMHSPGGDLLSSWASAVSFSKTFCSSMYSKTQCGFVGMGTSERNNTGVFYPPEPRLPRLKGCLKSFRTFEYTSLNQTLNACTTKHIFLASYKPEGNSL